jgi:hypothetical protein
MFPQYRMLDQKRGDNVVDELQHSHYQFGMQSATDLESKKLGASEDKFAVTRRCNEVTIID